MQGWHRSSGALVYHPGANVLGPAARAPRSYAFAAEFTLTVSSFPPLAAVARAFPRDGLISGPEPGFQRVFAFASAASICWIWTNFRSTSNSQSFTANTISVVVVRSGSFRKQSLRTMWNFQNFHQRFRSLPRVPAGTKCTVTCEDGGRHPPCSRL